jgi:hypothetical protein
MELTRIRIETAADPQHCSLRGDNTKISASYPAKEICGNCEPALVIILWCASGEQSCEVELLIFG